MLHSSELKLVALVAQQEISFTSSVVSEDSLCNIFTGFIGHSVSEFHRKLGPSSHRRLLINSSALRPLEASSAGLDFVSTYRHCDGVDPSCITATRFATNVSNRLSRLLM